MKARIVFLIVYYGRWPWYMNMWMKSVAANPSFEFILISDLAPPDHLPPNVRLQAISFHEVVARMSRVVGAELSFTEMHKLCDCRPFYAMAFPELVAGYDYWGYCDMDLFFGDLSPLQERADSGEWDFISPWIATVGHCTLVRNAERVNTVALKIPNHVARLGERGSTFMDEGGISETAFKAGGFRFGVLVDLTAEWRKERAFIGATVKPDGTISSLSGLFLIHCEPGRTVLYDREGKSHEIVYFHFMGMKQSRYWKQCKPEAPPVFTFTPYGFEPGLMSPAAIHSAGYKFKSYKALLPARIYAKLRGLLSPAVVERLKSLKKALKR